MSVNLNGRPGPAEGADPEVVAANQTGGFLA